MEVKFNHTYCYKVLVGFISLLLLSCGGEDTLDLDYSFEAAINVDKEINQFQDVEFESFEDLNLGFFRGKLWIKLEINNDDSRKSLMLINGDLINKNYTFYKLDTIDNELLLLDDNNKSNKENIALRATNLNFEVDLAPNEQAIFIIVGESDGRIVNATPQLISLSAYNSIVLQNSIESFVFIGAILFLLILNIYLWSIHKQRIYLNYILYMIGTLFMYLGFEGHFYVFGLENRTIDHMIFLIIRLWVFSLIVFTAKFLEVRQVNLTYYRFLLIVVVLILALNTLYQFLFIDTSVAYLHYYENVLSFLWLFLILLTVVVAARSRKLELKYYLVSLSFFLLFLVIGLIEGHFGLFPGSPFVYIKIGTLIEFIGFTYFMTVLIKQKIKNVEVLQSELNQKKAELTVKSKKLEEINQLEDNKANVEKTDLINIYSWLESALKDSVDWDVTSQMLQDTIPTFIGVLSLKHPGLSRSEIRLLILIRIGYNQKEIASILNIAPESVKKARGRVRKKMNLKSSINLNEYLNELE